MNKKLKYYIVISILFFSKNIFSQELDKKLPGNISAENHIKNPSVSNFTDYSNQDLVDLYTGMIDVNIPIYTVTDGDMNVPLVLKYRKDGIQVRETSGRTGLGWNIVSGGYITREIKGNPDEEIKVISPTTGFEYYANFGRYVDLTDFNPEYTPPHEGDEIPIGNSQGDKSMDYYVDLLVNNNLNSCNSIRAIDYQTFASNNPQGEELCEGYLIDALKNSPNIIDFNSAIGSENILYIWSKYRDTQPDIFHYSVPGASGSFVLDDSGYVKIISGTVDVKIRPGIGPQKTAQGWIVTTNNGVKHFFATSSGFTESTVVSSLQTQYSLGYLGVSDQYVTKEEFLEYPDIYSAGDVATGNDVRRVDREAINAWYISKMSSSKYNSDINFTYESQGTIEEFEIEETKMDFIRKIKKNYSSPAHHADFNTEPSHTTQINNQQPTAPYQPFINYYAHLYPTYYYASMHSVKDPKYLSKITFSGGEVEFINQDTERLDLPSNYALDKIVVRNDNLKKIKEFKFDYDYFFELPYVNTNESSRLILDEFYEISENDNKGKYLFEYNTDNKLPPNNSKKQDFWGYHNNNGTNSLIPEGNRHFKQFTGADRSPHEAKMKAWMLEKVTYPTGGHNEFFYEINRYVSNDDLVERPTGGLRVYKTITHDGTSTNNDIIKNYTFEQGRMVNSLDRNWWRHYQSDSRFMDISSNGYELNDYHYIKRSSTIMYPILKTKGAWVGYGYVTVHEDNNGKTVYRYTNSESHPDELANKTKFPYKDQIGSDNYHDNTHISKDALRGLLLSKTVYNSENKIVLYENNEYEESPVNIEPFVINSLKIEGEYQDSGKHISVPGVVTSQSLLLKHSLIDFGKIKSYFPYVKKKTVREYNLEDNIYNETISNYKKESDYHMQYTEITTDDSEDRNRKQKYYYPNDEYVDQFLSNDEITVLDIMNTHNRVEPIMSERYLNNALITRELNTFKNHNDIAVIKSTKVSKGNAALRDKVTFHRYDNRGNVVEFSEEDGVHVIYIWGYNKTVPIAKIQNTTYENMPNELQNLITQIQTISNTEDTTSEETILRNKLNALRNEPYFSNTLMTTYTYDPLVGIKSITEPDMNITYYHYDELNRLTKITDREGYVLRENKYNYKN